MGERDNRGHHDGKEDVWLVGWLVEWFQGRSLPVRIAPTWCRSIDEKVNRGAGRLKAFIAGGNVSQVEKEKKGD